MKRIAPIRRLRQRPSLGSLPEAMICFYASITRCWSWPRTRCRCLPECIFVALRSTSLTSLGCVQLSRGRRSKTESTIGASRTIRCAAIDAWPGPCYRAHLRHDRLVGLRARQLTMVRPGRKILFALARARHRLQKLLEQCFVTLGPMPSSPAYSSGDGDAVQ